MLTERSIVNFLIWIAGLIIGPYLAITTAEHNYYPIGAAVGAVFLVLIFGFWKDQNCVLPFLGLYIAGRLNFIPLRPAGPDICCLALIAYYLIAYTALRRKLVKTGPMFFFLPILIVGAILLYHAHNAGLRATGGGTEGARGGIFMLVACVTYVCGVSVNTPGPVFFARLPFYCLVVGILSAVPYSLTTYFPRTAPYLYMITDNINTTAYSADVLGSDEIVRNQGQAGIGENVAIFLMAYYPIFTWWRPNRWWVAVLGIGGALLVVMGGFRSSLVVFGITVLVSAWCYYSWRALLLIPPVILAVFLATAAQDSHLVKLPEAAQRSLSFLPGHWDPEVLGSSESSNHFRDKIREVYLKEYAKKSPLLGNGFSYDSEDFQRVNDLWLTQETPDGYYEAKFFVLSKQFHIGWISLYDGIGLIGGAAFVFLGLGLIWVNGRMIFGRGVDRKSPLFPMKVWLFCTLLPPFIGYFTVFGDIKSAFPAYCYFAILLTQLARLERHGYSAEQTAREMPFDPIRARTEMPAEA